MRCRTTTLVACGLLATWAQALVAQSLASAGDQTPPPTWTEPQTGLRFVYIPPGSFIMGSAPSEAERNTDETAHQVTISRGFYMSETEVTQVQWQAITGQNPSHFAQCGGDCPVERVDWNQVQAFIADIIARSDEEVLRLPSEAEWEYAARAGSETPFHTGYQIDANQANLDSRYPYDDPDAIGEPAGRKRDDGLYRGGPIPVGSFAPNAWGLYDMHGNVWEWCADWYCPYPSEAVVDPRGTCDSGRKVIRGGSWYFAPTAARSAARYHHSPEDIGFSLGFRLVRELPAEPNSPIAPDHERAGRD